MNESMQNSKVCQQIELPDNSPMGLMDALAKRLEAVLGPSWWYPNEHGEEQHAPHVHKQFLPVRKASDTKRDTSRDFPLVQLFHPGGKMEKSLDLAELKILVMFGGWCDDGNRQGWHIPAAMMWAALQDLLARPFIGAYEFVPPVEWTLPYEGEPPYWECTLITTWRCRSIMKEIGFRQHLPVEEALISFERSGT